MAGYYSLKRIAARLEVRTCEAVIKLLRHEGLPMYKRKPPSGRGIRVWYTTDELIRIWELGRAQQERENIDQAGRWKGRSWRRQRERERAAQDRWGAAGKAAPHESRSGNGSDEAA